MARKQNKRRMQEKRRSRNGLRRALQCQPLENRQLLAFNIVDDAINIVGGSSVNVLTNDTSGAEVQNVSAFNADLDETTYPALYASNDTDWFIPLRDDGVTPQRSIIPGAVMFNDNRADGVNGANRGDIDLLVDSDADFTNDDQLTEADRLDAATGIGLPVLKDNSPVGTKAVTGATNANLGVPQYRSEGGGGPNWIAIASGPENDGEHSVPISNAFFPFSAGWVGGGWNTNGTVNIGGTGVGITQTGTGRVTAAVDGVTNSYEDGFLFSVGGDNEDNYTRTRPIGGNEWAVQHRDNAGNINNGENDDFNLLYVPKSAQGLIGGVVDASSTDANPMIQSFGDFTIQRESDGFWRLSVPNHTARTGALVIETYDLTTDQPRNAYFSWDEAADNADEILIRQFEWTTSDTEEPLNTDFVFFFVPFENTLNPTPDTLTITELGTAADPTSGFSEGGLALAANPDGTVTYDLLSKRGGESGTDTFVYKATDGTLEGVGTVTINWAGVNDAPYVLSQPGNLEFVEDGAAETIDLTTVFADYDAGDVLTYSADPGVGNLVTIDISGTDAIITPSPDAYGFSRITLTATDEAGASASVVIEVTIDQADDGVVAVDDTGTVTDKVTPVDVAVLNNDYHPDTTPFSVAAAEILGNADDSWSIVAGTAGPNNLTLQSGPNRGDVAVGRGGTDLFLSDGVYLGTARDNTSPYLTVNAYSAFGSYGFATDTGLGGGERQGPLSAGFFPFAEGWTAGHIAADGSLIGGVGISSADVVKLQDGLFEVTIPEASFAAFDGMLFAITNSNDDNLVSVTPSGFDNKWLIRNLDSDAGVDGFENDSISFVYIPGDVLFRADVSAVGGRVVAQEGQRQIAQQYGNWSLTDNIDHLTINIPGYAPEDGALIAVSTATNVAVPDGAGGFITAPQNHAVLATPEGGDFRIDILNSGDYTPVGDTGEFQFIFLPYDAPLEKIGGLDFEITSFDTLSTLGASITLNGDGTLNYDPSGAGSPISDLNPGEVLEDTFTYTISDGRGDTSTATVTLTVQGENQVPTANDDVINLNELAAQGARLTVLGNDTDPDFDVIYGTPEYTVAGNLAVDASSAWSVAGTGAAPNAITLGAGTTGDVEVLRDGVAIAPTDGVVLATVRENYDGDATNFRLVQAYENGTGGTSLALQQFGADGAADAPVSVAYFPFADNWVGGHVDATGTLLSGNGLTAGEVTRTAAGRYEVTIPGVTESTTDGFLFVIGNENADNVASVSAVPGTDKYQVAVRDNTQDLGDGEDGGFSFVFVPRNAQDLVAGAINPFLDGPNQVDLVVGEYNIERQPVGDGTDGTHEWKLTIPGQTPDTGVLVLTNQDNTEIEDNYLTYQADGEGNFIIRSHDMNGMGRQAQPFTFAFVPFNTPGGPVPRPVPGPLSISSVDATSTLGATLSINADGTINYDPADLFDGLYNGDSAVDTFSYEMTDGFGGFSTASVTVNISGFGAAPVLVASPGASYYGLGDQAVSVAPNADLVPVGQLFLDGAVMTAEITAGAIATDELVIRNEGTGAGQVGVSGSDITYGGTIVASFTGGEATGTPLVITFNADGDEAAADAVLRAISYGNFDAGTFPGARQVTLGFTDANAFVSDEITQDVEIDFIRRRTLRQGLDAGYGTYAAASDTELFQGQPDTPPNPSDDILIDYDGGAVNSQGLLKFEGLFGDGPGQIPLGATITSANLVLDTNTNFSVNAPGDGATIHRMLQDWDDATATWNSFNNGVQGDDVEARAAFESQVGTAGGGGSTGTGKMSLSVLPDVRAWAAGEANYGWLLQGWVGNTDGWFFSTSENANAEFRPRLEVEWMPAGTEVSSFREGVDGYAGTVDTQIDSGAPDDDLSAAETVFIDSPTSKGLVRFDDIIGAATGQIPVGAKIISARLRTASVTNNAQGDGASFHKMLVPWSETDTFNTLTDGVEADDVEAMSIYTVAAGNPDRTPNVQGGFHDWDVTEDIQSWVNGELDNNGWLFNFWVSGTDGWGFQSSEAVTETERPRLEVYWTEIANAPPTDITIDTSSVNENTDTTGGLAIGTLDATDPDAGDSHTFELVAGAGDDDNGLFTISGDTLTLSEGSVLDFETQPSYSVRVRATDVGGLSVEKEITIDVVDLAEVESIVIGDGTESRSRIDQVVVTFDNEVTLGAAAFELLKRGTNGGAVPVDVSSEVIGGKTVATLTFSGAFSEFGSLVDGNYQLTISGDEVTDLGGNGLDGDQDGVFGGNSVYGDEEADAFFRFFGDTNGDRTINFADLSQILFAYESPSDYREDLDFDADGAINFVDLVQVLSRYETDLGFE